ncbi:hypothetical protein BAE44_0015958 [Dichanthelium oligosanthes]|uniref:Uncharacterized protein n=1 Tax=Dichanthelium oligosanthes TaxID=888268 RepID=A0A1E5VCZ2_9POAL|nr:hypothetical protein BAE44_0015958 [Dichanthelium oligosanthes]
MSASSSSPAPAAFTSSPVPVLADGGLNSQAASAELTKQQSLSGQSTSGDGDRASGTSDKALQLSGRSTANDASEHIRLALSIEGHADE